VRVRRQICSRLGFLGVELDNALNDGAVADADVSPAGAPVRIAVIRAREELVAARAARELLA
jgi:acetate kinase